MVEARFMTDDEIDAERVESRHIGLTMLPGDPHEDCTVLTSLVLVDMGRHAEMRCFLESAPSRDVIIAYFETAVETLKRTKDSSDKKSERLRREAVAEYLAICEQARFGNLSLPEVNLRELFDFPVGR